MKNLRAQRRSPLIKAGTGFLKHETGSVLLEFSLVLVCALIIIAASIEVCSAVYTYTVLADAANEGVHYAIINSTDGTGTAANTVKAYASNALHDMSRLNVSVTYPDGTTTPPARVAVSVSYQYAPYLSFFMTKPPTMHAFAEGRLVH